MCFTMLECDAKAWLSTSGVVAILYLVWVIAAVDGDSSNLTARNHEMREKPAKINKALSLPWSFLLLKWPNTFSKFMI